MDCKTCSYGELLTEGKGKGEMNFQRAVDYETAEYANAEQPEFFAKPTTDRLPMTPVLMMDNREPTLQVPRERQQIPRPHVIESLEHSLAEHGDIWAELASR